MGNRKGFAGIFRVIAGGYLIYLGVKLIRGGLLTGDMSEKARIFGVAASILFIVAGAFFIMQALRWLTAQNDESEEEQGEESAEAEMPREEPEPPAPAHTSRSLFDRAGFGASAYEEDEEEPEEEEDDT